jgi:hypothetical protein
MGSTTEQQLVQNEPIETQLSYANLIESLKQDNNANRLQDQLIQYIGTLKDLHHSDDKKWFQKLIYNNHLNVESEDIDLGILYNFTYLDAIVAKLLNISARKIIEIDIIKGYIKELWETNEQQQGFLESHILDDPQQRESIEKALRPSNQIISTEETNNSEINQGLSFVQTQPKNEEEDALMYEKETELQEVEMIEADPYESKSQEDESNSGNNITTILLKDIKKTSHYKTRNRMVQTLNPYFITDKGDFTAGTLIANTPGENKQEQKTYLANIFRLPKAQISLIKNLFYNGNGWYTINFQYQHDMINCIQKINNKNDKDFKLIYITGGPNITESILTKEEIKFQSTKN